MANITVKALGVRYMQNDQKNPLEWMILKKKSDDSFTNTTNWFQCKDYFNDFCIYKNTGKVFEAYGMNSDNAVFDDKGGLWVLLGKVTENLGLNINNTINKEFADGWNVHLEYTVVDCGGRKGLLYLPHNAFNSTLRISILSLLIRNCNVDHLIQSYDDLVTPEVGMDGGLDDARYLMLKDRLFYLPEEEEYYYYIDGKHNSKAEAGHFESLPSYCWHNNGYSSFTDRLVPEHLKNKVGQYKLIPNEDECDDWDDEYSDEEEECCDEV